MKSPDLEAMIQQVEYDSFNCLNCGKHLSEHQQTFNAGDTEIYWACVKKLGNQEIGSFNGKPMQGQMFIITGRYEKAES